MGKVLDEESCSFKLNGLVDCSRRRTTSPDGAPNDCCILHSSSDTKNIDDFRRAIEELVAKQGDTINLVGAIFPGEFKFPAVPAVGAFRRLFLREASFLGAVEFADCRVRLDLKNATFAGALTWHGGVLKNVLWDGAVFEGPVKFEGCNLEMDKGSAPVRMKKGLSFHRGEQSLYLSECQIAGECVFEDANVAILDAAGGRFERIRFKGGSLGGSLAQAVFCAASSFKTKLSRISFDKSVFVGGADFSSSEFGDSSVSFNDAVFVDEDGVGNPVPGIADFSSCDLRGVAFKRVNRSSSNGVSFRFVEATGLSTCDFEHVNWNRVPWLNHAVVQDLIDLKSGQNLFQERPRGDDADAVSAVYRQLSEYFEDKGHFDRREDCRWGDREGQRLKLENLWGGSRYRDFYMAHPRVRSLASYPTFAGLYKMASQFGTSYVWALGIVLFVLLGFGLLYSIPQVTRMEMIETEDASEWGTQAAQSSTWTPSKVAARVGMGILHSSQVATFSRQRRYRAVDPLGHGLEVAESILVPGLAALFLLALRRRFRDRRD